MVDSLQIDPAKRRDKETLEEKGTKFLKKIDDIKKQDAINRLHDNDKLNELVRQQESQLQAQQMEIQTLKSNLTAALKELASKDSLVKGLEDKVASLGEESKNLSKELKAAVEKNQELKEANMEVRRQLGGLEKQKSGVEKEQGAMLKTQKKFETEMIKKDQKISKLTEELEKAKLDLKAFKGVKTESSGESNKLTERLVLENKKLEKQRNELLNGFRKQMKLIEILKRQRIHLEAAQM